MSGDYEDLTECALSAELEQKLVATQRECVFMWTNTAGEAFGVVMSYLPKDGRLWLTAAAQRKRIAPFVDSPAPPYASTAADHAWAADAL